MTAKEFIRFVLGPGCIAGMLIQSFGISLPTFACGETAAITSMIAAFTGYMAYLYETERMERMAEMKARSLEEAERIRTECEERCRWEQIMSWRDQITGQGTGGANAKEVVSPWQES